MNIRRIIIITAISVCVLTPSIAIPTWYFSPRYVILPIPITSITVISLKEDDYAFLCDLNISGQIPNTCWTLLDYGLKDQSNYTIIIAINTMFKKNSACSELGIPFTIHISVYLYCVNAFSRNWTIICNNIQTEVNVNHSIILL